MDEVIGTTDEISAWFPGRWIAVEFIDDDHMFRASARARVVGLTEDQRSAWRLTDPAPLRRTVLYGVSWEDQKRIVIVLAP